MKIKIENLKADSDACEIGHVEVEFDGSQFTPEGIDRTNQVMLRTWKAVGDGAFEGYVAGIVSGLTCGIIRGLNKAEEESTKARRGGIVSSIMDTLRLAVAKAMAELRGTFFSDDDEGPTDQDVNKETPSEKLLRRQRITEQRRQFTADDLSYVSNDWNVLDVKDFDPDTATLLRGKARWVRSMLYCTWDGLDGETQALQVGPHLNDILSGDHLQIVVEEGKIKSILRTSAPDQPAIERKKEAI